MAFQYFAEQGVEWAVVEVGLGGRLDATNVVHPAVCAITSLSYDHVELLGHTLSLIAFEKAGIIKQGVPVVSAPQEAEAMAVIQRVCQGHRREAVGRRAGLDAGEKDGADITGQSLTVQGLADVRPSTTCASRCWASTSSTTRPRPSRSSSSCEMPGVTSPKRRSATGWRTARWPGRFELLSQSPMLVVDSAHNENSAHKLRCGAGRLLPAAAAAPTVPGVRRLV